MSISYPCDHVPTFEIAMFDTDDSDCSVEGLEASHEKLEEVRAAQLVGAGAINAARPNTLRRSAKAQELADKIGDMAYKSDFKPLLIDINRALVRNQISNSELDYLLALYEDKKSSIIAPTLRPTSRIKPWSPSDILSTMPIGSGRDSRELAANDRRDKED